MEASTATNFTRASKPILFLTENAPFISLGRSR